MDATLEEVLKVLTQTLRLERTVVHLAQGNNIFPSAAIRVHEEDDAEVYDPGDAESSALVRQTLEKARSSRQSQNVIDPQAPFVSPFAVVPILWEDELLGLIEVENYRSQRSVTEAELDILTNLAIEVAVAIQDVRYHYSFERWKHHLEQILTEVDRVDSFGERASGLTPQTSPALTKAAAGRLRARSPSTARPSTSVRQRETAMEEAVRTSVRTRSSSGI